MKYLALAFIIFTSLTCRASLTPIDDQQLASIRGQAKISTSAKEEKETTSNRNLLQQFSLLSQQALSANLNTQDLSTKQSNETWESPSTQLMLRSIPFFGFLFALASQNEQQ